jgi:hypothetical protein
MLHRCFLAAIIAMSFVLIEAAAQKAAPVSENDRTRPGKQEIIDWMLRTKAMPRAQQESRIDRICDEESAGRTQRSDFLFCIGLAYSGNYKGQACAGRACETGRGIVEDLMEAHTWYTLALENPDADKAEAARLQADKARVKNILVSVYPAPSDFELQELAAALKNRISQYQEEIKKTEK